MSFSSRVTRHLALCARMYPLKDRRDFIEVHRRSIIKLNLPTTLIDDIEKKESLFSEYTSAELLEIIVSYLILTVHSRLTRSMPRHLLHRVLSAGRGMVTISDQSQPRRGMLSGRNLNIKG